MNDWIDFAALAKILICGAGLPAVFALGLRALHMGAPAVAPVAAASGPRSVAEHQTGSPDRLVGGSPLGIVLAGLCFATVLAAVGWGIYLIVAGT